MPQDLGYRSLAGAIVGQVDQVAEDEDRLVQRHQTRQRPGRVVDIGDDEHQPSWRVA